MISKKTGIPNRQRIIVSAMVQVRKCIPFIDKPITYRTTCDGGTLIMTVKCAEPAEMISFC